VKGFSGRFENPLSLDCVLSQFARESRTSRNEISHSPRAHPEISFVDNLVFTFGSLRDSGDGDEIKNNDKTTLGR
jgi:hypothetical protein